MKHTIKLADANEAAAAHYRAGRLADAERLCLALLAANTSDFPALHLLGILRLRQGRVADGLACLDRAVAAAPDSPAARNSRGNALQMLRRFDLALQDYDRALALQPRQPAVLNNRGDVLLALGRPAEALASYDQALAIDGHDAIIHCNRGNALRTLGRPAEALASYDRALALRPAYAQALNNRAGSLQALDRIDEALAGYEAALAVSRDAEVLNNRGTAYQALNHIDAALASYAEALALKPEHAEARWNRAFALLLKGDFAAGLPEYEWRWRRPGSKPPRNFSQAAWSGAQGVAGRTVLLHAEQGFGDTIQFCRYAQQVSSLGANVILEVQAPLKSLLARMQGVATVVAHGEALPDFDLHCPLLSLPLALKTRFDALAAPAAYLHADPQRIARWSARLGPKKARRIGLAWSGGINHRNDRHRSLPLASLAPLLGSGMEFVCLQNEIREPDRTVLETLPGLLHFENEIRDYDDTAALVQACDLVIAVDTSVAHLAGAMGKPVWILLPFAPDWRWLLDREDSPWYPAARLLRQPAPGNWRDLLSRLGAELGAE